MYTKNNKLLHTVFPYHIYSKTPLFSGVLLIFVILPDALSLGS